MDVLMYLISARVLRPQRREKQLNLAFGNIAAAQTTDRLQAVEP